MHESHELLTNLALILCVAAVTTVVFQKLRQPVVLGYLLAGLIVGPHVPIPLVADPALAQTLSELGVILLMFSLGLEFSLRKLIRVGPTAGIIAVIQCSLMIWLGYLIGRLFGWTVYDSIFAGAMIAISSTTIIVKAFAEQGIKGKRAELVFGVLIVEDLIAILLLAILTAVATGSTVSASALAATTGRLIGFLIALIVAGLLIIPRLVRLIVRLDRPETTVVATAGICFALASLAHAVGYSVALGAFLAGSLVAESGEGDKIEHLIQPVRDMFAAIFFVAVGMLIEPALVLRHWTAVAALTLTVVLGKVGSVALGAFLSGSDVRTSLQAGMSLAQIGEFSFIIAAVGQSLGVVSPFLYPIAVAVSALTTLVTPWLIRASDPVAKYIDRRLPRPVQTFASLYGSWLEQLRAAPRRESARSEIRKSMRLLLEDVAAFAAILIVTSIYIARWALLLEGRLGIGAKLAYLAIIATAVVLSAPFLVGTVRAARFLGQALALEAFPLSGKGKPDLAAVPRRMLVVTLQLGILLLLGAPLVAVTQPLLPVLSGAPLLLFLLIVWAFSFWRSAAHLQERARAGAQIVLDALAKQSRAGVDGNDAEPMRSVRQLLPGLGEPFAMRLDPQNACVGKTLAELNVHALTGATVLAIRRGADGILIPMGEEVLRAGDVLALAGTNEAVELARVLLSAGNPPPLAEGSLAPER